LNDRVQRSLRHQTIISTVLGSRQPVSVSALSELTGVSAITIRRDLAELEAHGALRRLHGAAASAPARGAPMPFALRADALQESKRLLAAAVDTLVLDGQSLIVDGGTTGQAIGGRLAGRAVTGLALSLHTASALARRPGTRVLVPGGPLAPDSLAFEGGEAADYVRQLRVDLAILAACSASPEHGLTSTSPEDARLKRACLDSASRTLLVATPDKLERTSTFRIAGVESVSGLLTTRAAHPDLLAQYAERGVQVQLAEDLLEAAG
jgi:DeoR/GlpR family transcriptional regulator of sugar metabolism